MKRTWRAGWVVTILSFFAVSALAPVVSAAPLTLPFTDLGGYSTNQMTNYAASASPVSPITSTGTRYYRGAFTPSSANTRIAIHSDDGSDVYVNGVKVVAAKGAGTHWQDLASSLTILSSTFTAGVEYCIEIDYQNTAYTQGDTDGVSLYAFNGGGSVRDGIALRGTDSVCAGGTAAWSACGDPPFTWSCSPAWLASVSGTGNDVTVSAWYEGTGTITATDSNGKSGTRALRVFRLQIEPIFSITCEGWSNWYILTNAEVSSGVAWDPAGTVSANTRTNQLAFPAPGTNILSATWQGCTAYATAVVIRVQSATASTNRLCAGGQVIYSATTVPAGMESYVLWTGEASDGAGPYFTSTYATPGIKLATASCGPSSQTATVTVHKVDITNALEYALAGGSAAPFRLSDDSVGPYTWSVTPSGPSVIGSGSSVTVSAGSTPGAYTVKAEATPLPSCNDTSTLQVVQVMFSGGNLAFCEGTTSNVTFTVNPSSALSLLSFDTVTNTATGGTNTHSHVTVSGTNLTVHGDVAGTAYLRAKLGNTVLVGPTLQIVRVTFPTNDWYVGVGKSITNFVTIVPTNAPVTFDTVSNAIATASAVSGGVKLTGVAPGTTQIRAIIGGGMICASKDVTAVRVQFATNWIVLCKGNSTTVGVTVEPSNAPVTYVATTNLLQLNVQGTNVTVTPSTNLESYVSARVAGAVMDELKVSVATVRFLPNWWYAAPGGTQSYNVYVEPQHLAPYIGFMSLNTNIAAVTANCAPPCVTVHGVTNGSTTIVAFAGATNQSCSSKPLDVVSPIIDSIQWVNMDGSALTNTNPNLGNGFRVFPDSPSPGAPPANQIRVRATLVYPVAAPNAVFFRAFDVDDPYTNAPPVDDETKTADNNGTLVQLPGTAFSTDANGVAEATFTLTMQPGDNFRVVGATSASYFNDLAAKQNDGTSASVTNSSGAAVPANRITSLLTVWRRLHVEVDSMEAVPPGANEVSGQITTIHGSPSLLATQVVANLFVAGQPGYLDTGVPVSNGRFENGTIRMGDGLTVGITTNILGNGNDFFRTKPGQFFHIPFVITKGAATAGGYIWMLTNASPNPILGIYPPLTADAFNGGLLFAGGQTLHVLTNTTNLVTVTESSVAIPFTAVDDDHNGLLPRFPDCSDLTRAFNPTYVLPLLDLPNPTPLVPFVRNMPNASLNLTEFRSIFRFDNVASEADPAFWTVYVLGAFQPIVAQDSDPDAESAIVGVVDKINGQGAVIFHEVHREYPDQPNWAVKYTVTHEVGHLFNGAHTDDGIMTSNGVPTSVDFSPQTINRIRTILNP